MFSTMPGIKLVHIPYRGDAPMVTALIGGDIQLAFLPQANGIPKRAEQPDPRARRHRTKRMEALPDVPTAREQGFQGLEIGSWNAMFVAAGTPPDIVLNIQQTLAKALADPKVREVLAQTGQTPVGNSPAEFDAQYKAGHRALRQGDRAGRKSSARLEARSII